MTTAWAHLPNAALIDEVLTSLKAHPEKWSTAWDASRAASQAVLWGSAWAAARGAARGAAWAAAQAAARNAAWDAARSAAWYAARSAAWNAARDALRSTAQVAAGNVIAALIAYDDAGQFMKLPVEQLKAMYRLDPHPMYLLLRPAAVVFMEVEP